MELDSRALDRSRIGWWLLVVAVLAGLAFVLHSLVGTFVLALFVYYGMRPLDRRLESYLSASAAAAASILVVGLPVLLLVAAVAVVGVAELGNAGLLDQAQSALEPYLGGSGNPAEQLSSVGGDTGSATDALRRGAGVLSALAGGLMHLFLAVTAAFYLLRDDHRLRGWFRSTVGGAGTTAYAYATAVDRDLATIYFGNVLLVAVVAAAATVVYHAYNLVAPATVSIPAPTALALLTGFASLVPIVVGKLVYVPLTLALAAQAFRTDPGLLVYPAVLFVVGLVLLDLVPMTFVLPKVAGKAGHTGLVLFAYILGPMLFGWYGLFFGPLLLVVGVQTVRIVLEELIHGEPLTPAVTSAEPLGSPPDTGDGD